MFSLWVRPFCSTVRARQQKLGREIGSFLFWYRQQNDQYNQVPEGEKDQQPHDPGEFALEFALFAKMGTHIISRRPPFGGHRLFDRNRVKPDQTRTDRTADGLVPASSLSCCSPLGERDIIFW